MAATNYIRVAITGRSLTFLHHTRRDERKGMQVPTTTTRNLATAEKNSAMITRMDRDIGLIRRSSLIQQHVVFYDVTVRIRKAG
jgi:hypothetical protein